MRSLQRTRLFELPLVAALGLAAACPGLSGCDLGQPYSPPPEPLPPPLTRVVALRFDPDTVAVGDTMEIHIVVEDSLNDGLTYDWTIGPILPVDGHLNGPQIRWIAQPIGGQPGEVMNGLGGVHIRSDVPGSRILSYNFSIPVLTPSD